MSTYLVTIQTVKQYLIGDPGTQAIITAEDEYEADEKASQITKILDADVDPKSVHRVYSYHVEEQQ